MIDLKFELFIIILNLNGYNLWLTSNGGEVKSGFTLNTTRNVCPSGWQQYKDKCYTITSTQINSDWSGGLSWSSADSLCKQLSATLVKTESIDENSFIHDWYQNIRPRPNIPFWIGAKRINGVIKWQDGTSLKYSNWYSKQPDRDGDCIEVVPKGAYTHGYWSGHPAAVWNDYPCSGGRGVVCQMPAGSVITIPRISEILKYLMRCGAEIKQLNSTILNITSPNYPQNYTENLNCIWKITAPINQRILLKFNEFETEQNHDFVKVYDGLSENNTILGTFSGSTKPNNLISGENFMTILFKSDHSINMKGFSASLNISDAYNQLTAIFSNSHMIWTYNFETNKRWEIYTGAKTIKSIAYNCIGNYLTWIDINTDKICIKYIKDKDKRICVSDDGKPDFLCVDWIHDLLYWIDMKTLQIKVLNVKKPQFKYIILNITKEEPRDLILNAKLSKLVWIIIGDKPEIMQSNQDGSQQSILYNTAKQAIHLAIDYQKDYYYFISLSDYTLYSIDFNGNNEQSYIQSRTIFSRAYTINVLNDDLFLYIDNAIIRLPKISLNISRADIIFKSSDFNHSQNYLNLNKYTHSDSISHVIYWGNIIDPLLQPSFTNKCQLSNCSHICLPSDKKLSHICLYPNSKNQESATNTKIRELWSMVHILLFSLLLSIITLIGLLLRNYIKIKKLQHCQNPTKFNPSIRYKYISSECTNTDTNIYEESNNRLF